jgi:hypothetical protein
MFRKLSFSRALVCSFGLTSLLGLYCCVGDDPASVDDAGSGTDSSTPVEKDATTPPEKDATTPPVDTGIDSSLVCTGKDVACGTTCVDLTTSDDNCNACGRSCGGGKCVNGECGPATLRDNIASFNGFTLDDTSLYFSTADKVMSCPIGACTGAPKQLVAMVAYDARRPYVDSGFLYFQSSPNQATDRPAIFRCPVAGCPNPPSSIVGDGLNGIASYSTFQKSLYANLGGSGIGRVDCSSGACVANVNLVPRPVGQFAVDAQRVYFNDTTGGGSQLASCPLAAGCTVRTPISTSRVQGPIAVVGNLVYFVGPGLAGGDSVLACPTTGVCATPSSLVKLAGPIPNLAADANGIFWTDGDKLVTCSSVACPGGAKTIAEGLANPGYLQLDAKFAYVRTDGSTAGTSAIKRIARP